MKFKKIKIRKKGVLFIPFLLFILWSINTAVVYGATTAADIKANQVYQTVKDPNVLNLIQHKDVAPDMLRIISWVLTIGLGKLADVLFTIFTYIANIFTISLTTGGTEQSVSNEIAVYFNYFKIIAAALFAVFLIYTIIKKIYDPINTQPISELTRQIIIIFLLISVFPTLFSMAGQVTNGIMNELTQSTSDNMGKKVINQNTYSVRNSVTDDKLINVNQLTNKTGIKTDIYSIDINAGTKEEPLNKIIDNINVVNKENIAVGHDSKQLYWGQVDELNYKYSLDFLPCIITLIGIVIALFINTIRMSKNAFEMIGYYIFGTPIIASDVGNTGRTKVVITGLINTFLVIILTTYMMLIYMTFISVILKLKTGLDISSDGLIKAFLILGLSLFAIDGASIFVHAINVDAGMKDGFTPAKLIALGIGRKVSNRVGKIANKAKSGAKKVPGKIAKSAGKHQAKKEMKVTNEFQNKNNIGKEYGQVGKKLNIPPKNMTNKNMANNINHMTKSILSQDDKSNLSTPIEHKIGQSIKNIHGSNNNSKQDNLPKNGEFKNLKNSYHNGYEKAKEKAHSKHIRKGLKEAYKKQESRTNHPKDIKRNTDKKGK